MVKNMLAEFWLMKQVEMGRTVTLQEVADVAGCSMQNIAKYKAGQVSKLDRDVINGICKFFNCEPGLPVPFLIYSPDLDE